MYIKYLNKYVISCYKFFDIMSHCKSHNDASLKNRSVGLLSIIIYYSTIFIHIIFFFPHSPGSVKLDGSWTIELDQLCSLLSGCK